jgi:DNA-binding cell septation regulator SpoVG
MRVSKVWVNKYSSGKLIGFADVAFSVDDENPKALDMIWKGFKLFQGDNGGVQIALPSRKDEKGKTDDNGRDIYYPTITINRAKEGEPKGKADEFFDYLQGKVEEEYHKTSSGKSGGGGGQTKSVASRNTGTVGDDDIPF